MPSHTLDYRRVEDAATEAAALAQKIIDARLALTRLRQTHPHPRLTIPLADEKLMDQVTEMQTLNDEVESVNQQVQAVKDGVKRGALELESLRVERTEVEKPVKLSRIDENDKRLAPLYDWCVVFHHVRHACLLFPGTRPRWRSTALCKTCMSHTQRPITSCG